MHPVFLETGNGYESQSNPHAGLASMSKVEAQETQPHREWNGRARAPSLLSSSFLHLAFSLIIRLACGLSSRCFVGSHFPHSVVICSVLASQHLGPFHWGQ